MWSHELHLSGKLSTRGADVLKEISKYSICSFS